MTEQQRTLEERLRALKERERCMSEELRVEIANRRRAEQALAQRVRLAALITDIGNALIQAGSLRSVLNSCAAALVKHLDAAFARIWTLKREQDVLELQASAGLYTHLNGSHSHIPVGRLKIGVIAQQRKPHLTNSVIGDALVNDQEWAKREGMVAFAGYPLIIQDRLVGVMGMFSRQPLTEVTLEAMAAVANNLAIGIERKRVEEEREQIAEVARRRASELELILDGIVDGVFVCDKDSRIVDANKAGLKMLGLACKEEARRPEADFLRLIDLRHPDGRPIQEGELVLSRALRGDVVHNFEQVARGLETGRDVHFLISAAPLRDREGSIVGAVGVLSDITPIRELDKLKDQFISVAAHELKTPVTIVKGYAQALLRTSEEVAPLRRKMLDAINRGSDRIEGVVNDLLDVSKLTTGRLELVVERINLPEFVSEVVDRVTLTATRNRVQLVSFQPLAIRGDRDRLEQVLMNLVGNAIKYSPNGTDVDVTVSMRAREAVVSVTDHGLGIPRGKQDHIFQRFYSAHTDTPFDFSGMGVGLYISQEIVVRHGGRMWFESEEGKGSTFYFSIPLH